LFIFPSEEKILLKKITTEGRNGEWGTEGLWAFGDKMRNEELFYVV
jgi:hypothetical protein